MTTEQMNETLSDYIETDMIFQYHMDWNSIMLVIDKLKDKHRDDDGFKKIVDLFKSKMIGTILLRYIHEACFEMVVKIKNNKHEH